MRRTSRLMACWALILSLSVPAAVRAEPFPLPASMRVKDTLRIGEEPNADARACLTGLVWTPGEFEITCESPQPEHGDALVRFPSPIATGDERNDRVAMEWYVARDENQQPCRAPAVVVVHESGSRMTFGRLIAGHFQRRGIHAFLLHLPHYGERRTGKNRPHARLLVPVLRQAIADVRRSYDVVAALPLVDRDRIALQGTSLGGFICATTGSLDGCYDQVYLLLAGGDLYDVLEQGQRDAARFREQLQQADLWGDPLRELLKTIEPTRLAHRADPSRTWLYSARYDTVVPPKNSDILAAAMQLPADHHIRLAADHYSGVIYLPFLIDQMAESLRMVSVPAQRGLMSESQSMK